MMSPSRIASRAVDDLAHPFLFWLDFLRSASAPLEYDLLAVSRRCVPALRSVSDSISSPSRAVRNLVAVEAAGTLSRFFIDFRAGFLLDHVLQREVDLSGFVLNRSSGFTG